MSLARDLGVSFIGWECARFCAVAASDATRVIYLTRNQGCFSVPINRPLPIPPSGGRVYA
jgi:hypothetical protein